MQHENHSPVKVDPDFPAGNGRENPPVEHQETVESRNWDCYGNCFDEGKE